MKRWRVVYDLEVEAESAESAYEQTRAFVGFLLERKREGHQQLKHIMPLLGLESETYEVGR